MSDRIRLGVIGAGAHASENLLPAVRVSPDIDIVAVCTRSPFTADTAARRWGVPLATTSLDELCDVSDALLACGPPALHEEVIAVALERRLPIFVEKPPARSAARLDRLRSGPCAPAPLSPVFVDYNMRFCTAWKAACSVLPADQVKLLRVRMVARKPREPMWGFTSVVRSLLLSVGIHGVDMAISVLGASELVTSSVADLGRGHLSVCVTLRARSGATALLEVGNYANSFETQVDMVGDDSRTQIDNLTRITSRRGASARLSDKAVESVDLGGLSGGFDRNGYGPAVAHFAAVAHGRIESTSDLVHSVKVLSVLDKLCAIHDPRSED